MTAMRMCKLEEDLRPDDTSITLTCTACTAPIRKGNTYGILVNTNLIYCASCSVNPIIVDEPKPLAFVNPAAQPRPSLLPGQWSRNHARCIGCGKTERPHAAFGRCSRCDNKVRGQGRVRAPATGNRGGGRRLAPGQWALQHERCIDCGTIERPHDHGGRCKPCAWKAQPPRVRKTPARSIGGQPLPPGKWSKRHERCVNCGTTDSRHSGNGRCERCRDRATGDRHLPMSASGRVCGLCGRNDVRHHARGLCQRCWKIGHHAGKRAEKTGQHVDHCACFTCADHRRTQNQQPRGRDWRGMPFAEAVVEVELDEAVG